MIKYVTLLFASFVFLTTTAQIAITKSDLPQAGETYYTAQSFLTSYSDSDTGPNYTWDFTDLDSTGIDTVDYVSVSQTPLAYQFYFNNPLLYPAYVATEATKGSDFSLGGQLTVTNVYLYTKTATSKFEEVGQGFSLNGFPFSVKYDDIRTIFDLPLTYNDQGSDHYKYLISIPTLGAMGQEGDVDYTVDGWGTVMTPFGTFDAVRVKHEISKEDTIYLDTLGFGFKIPSQETVYEWYAQNEGIPVLTIVKNGIGIVTSVKYKTLPGPNSVGKRKALTSVEVFPQPAGEMLYVTVGSYTAGDVKININSIDGRILISDIYNSSRLSIPTGDLAAGSYILSIEYNGMSHHRIILIH